jgi:acetyl-CoA acyltransferase
MTEAVVVTAVRTPGGRAGKGAFRTVRPEDLAAAAIRGALERTPGLDPADIDDIILGCAFPEAEQGLNLGRQVVLSAGLPESVPGVTLNRFCASGLQAIVYACQQVAAGMAEVVLAGGVESMSRVPGGGNTPMADIGLMASCPDLYLNMGLTAEKVAERFDVTREQQDAFAAESHRRALAAQAGGRFDQELVPVEVVRYAPGPEGKPVEERFVQRTDEGPRVTSPEALAALKPAFKRGGTVTAGNASQTTDGAAMTVVMSSDRAAALGLQPLLRLVSFAVGGVDPGVMGIGPVVAIPKALRLAGLRLDDIDVIELNEAFASQAVYVMRHLGLDPEKTNVNGGAVALGHPMGCTGAKLTATLAQELSRREARYGMVSMCIAGGMGAAAVFENLRV